MNTPKHPQEFEGMIAYMQSVYRFGNEKINLGHTGEVIEFTNEKITHWHEERNFVKPFLTMVRLN